MRPEGQPTALPRTPDSTIAAIVDRAELEDIVCYGLTAQSAAGCPLPPVKGNDDSDPEMTIRTKLQPDELTVRVIVRAHTTDVALKVDAGAIYSIRGILEYPSQAIVRFIVDSAIPTIYPFVREIIADTSRRVGVEQYLIVSLEPPRFSDVVLNRMADDVARRQQEVIAESRP